MSQIRIRELDLTFLLLVIAPPLAMLPIFRFAAFRQPPSANSDAAFTLGLFLFTLGLIAAPIAGFLLAIRNRPFRPFLYLGVAGLAMGILVLLGNLGWMDLLPGPLSTAAGVLMTILVIIYVPAAIVVGVLWVIRRARLIRVLQ